MNRLHPSPPRPPGLAAAAESRFAETRRERDARPGEGKMEDEGSPAVRSPPRPPPAGEAPAAAAPHRARPAAPPAPRRAG